MASVSLRGVSVQYPSASVPAVSEVDLDAADGEFVVISGGPRSGTSTLLRVVAGHQDLLAGQVLFDGVEMTATTDPGPLSAVADRVLRLDGGRVAEQTAHGMG